MVFNEGRGRPISSNDQSSDKRVAVSGAKEVRSLKDWQPRELVSWYVQNFKNTKKGVMIP